MEWYEWFLLALSTLLAVFIGFGSLGLRIRIDRAPKDSTLDEIYGEQIWVMPDYTKVSVEDMDETFVRNTLGHILRKLRSEPDPCVAYVSALDRVIFAPLMRELVDNEIAFFDENGKLKQTNLRR